MDSFDGVLNGQKDQLYRALMEEDERLARMYLGTLMVLEKKDNPARFPAAAHLLRELMEKFPEYRFPESDRDARLQLKQMVQHLQQKWQGVLKHQQWPGDPPWKGKINQPLQSFLLFLDEFFQRFDADMPSRMEQVENWLRLLDPLQYKLPSKIEGLRMEEWSILRKYFIAVCHHRKECNEEEFESFLFSLERFLLDRLRPKTFEDHARIDQIIKEGERNASS